MRIRKEITVDYAHRLSQHNGQCSNIHGHTGRIVVELSGRTDPRTGMVMDFGDMKRFLDPIRDRLDHAIVLNDCFDQDIIHFMQAKRFKVMALWDEPTAENLARWVYNTMEADDLPVSEVTFYETENNYAIYRGEGDEPKETD